MVGPILGVIVAQFIGRTYTFLVFSNRELLPVHITAQTLQFAALAVGLSVGAMLVPAWGAARHSIVTYKQEVARQTRGPFWQRWFIDFLLLAVAGYGYYLLMGRQSILTLGEAGDVFSDPLLLLVPALFIFATRADLPAHLPLPDQWADPPRAGATSASPSCSGCARSGASRGSTPAWCCC